MQHILKSQQFNRPFLETLFEETERLQDSFVRYEARQKLRGAFRDKMLFNIFYEPSTRTRLSFAAAAEHLGMDVVTTENAREFSSAAKGETLEDTTRVLCGYRPDIIVLRHHETGGAERAAAVSSVPIINAGDGAGQHPTQALLDLYTIFRERKTVDGLTVVIGGDLKNGRTARSLAYLLAKFAGVNIIFVSPPELRVASDIKEYLRRHNVSITEENNLNRVLPQADVVYWTRIQRERMKKTMYEKTARRYQIGTRELSFMRPDAVLLHPLPRVGEITRAVDKDRRAAYFRQTENGMYIRMVILAWLLREQEL